MPADKKKGKKSKKQKKKELEEKRRLEEELLRQQQEEERKRQEELERQRREEEERQRLLREKKRKEELVRLEKESEEDAEEIEKRQIDLQKLISEQYEQTKWKKHLKCDPFHDISNERQLNDFLTQWKEWNIYQNIDFPQNNENDSNNPTKRHTFEMQHIKYYIQDIENGYKLLHILQDVLFDAIQQNNPQKLEYAQSKYIEIGQTAQHKLDLLTQQCLQHDLFTSVAHAGLKEDGDVIKHCMQKNIKFGLWASSMSNAFKNSKIEYVAPISIKLELPKQIAMKAKMPLSCRVAQYAHNFYIYGNKGRVYECIGPVINVELLRLPPPPENIYGAKTSNESSSSGWMVQNTTEQKKVPNKWKYANVDKPDPKSAESMSISCKIPPYIVISDPNNVRLGWWNDTQKEWRTDDFKDIAYDSEQRIVSFITCHLSPICLVQERGMYYEYLDWKLTPSGVERCKISLITKCKMKIDIEIIGGQCKLLKPNIPELQHVFGKKLLRPHQLIRYLKTSGINLCYNNDGNTSRDLLNKNDNIELLTHLEISSIAALFQISMSKWNKTVANEDIMIFRLRKPLTPNEEADLLQNRIASDGADGSGDGDNMASDTDSWQTVMIDDEKCTFIDCNENSKEICLNTPLRELSHKTLLRCLSSSCTEDNLRDLQNTSFRFKETIKRMLNLLNVFRV
eukprot:530774_1